MKCNYCGKNFLAAEALKSCQKCGKSSSCSLIRCPYCYYEFIPEPKWFKKFLGLFQNKNKKPIASCSIMTLKNLNKGANGKIINITSEEKMTRRKIMAMGLLPGITINLIQKFPSIIVKVGESQFAIDIKLANLIEVEAK